MASQFRQRLSGDHVATQDEVGSTASVDDGRREGGSVILVNGNTPDGGTPGGRHGMQWKDDEFSATAWASEQSQAVLAVVRQQDEPAGVHVADVLLDERGDDDYPFKCGMPCFCHSLACSLGSAHVFPCAEVSRACSFVSTTYRACRSCI